MTVENYISELPDKSKVLTFELHNLLIEKVPNIIYSIKYGIPYYQYYGHLCYITPKPNFIRLGFVKGHLLSNQHGNLVGENLKLVRHILIHELRELNQALLLDTIYEAMILNELQYKNIKKK